MEIPDVSQVSVLYQENQVVLLFFAREAAPGQAVATIVGHDHHVVPEGETRTPTCSRPARSWLTFTLKLNLDPFLTPESNTLSKTLERC